MIKALVEANDRISDSWILIINLTVHFIIKTDIEFPFTISE